VLRVAVLASGRGSNLHSLLQACAKGVVDARVTLVASDRADAGALDVARGAGVPAVLHLGTKGEAYHRELLEALRQEAPDLVVLAGYLRLVDAALCDAFQGRIVNIHPGLLPSFKGLKAQRQALEAGVRVAGCTTHIVTPDLDAGPILLQAALAVHPDDTEASLAQRILRLEHLLLPRTVQLFAEGRITLDGCRARIAPGPTWLDNPRVGLVAGALYGEGF
jgi:phosphoribosylglycinamide formyltransferase 1